MLLAARPVNPLAHLIDEVMRLNGRLKSVFAGTNSVSGLPSMELTVLTAVAEARSPPTVAQIGRSLGHPRQVIQRAANALIDAGLIETAPNPDHKRALLLLPTQRGRDVKRTADAHAAVAAGALLRRLGASRCRRLAEQLHELRGEIEAHLRTRET